MNSTVAAALTAEMATLSAMTPTPVEPFGYGADLSCDTDLDALCSEVSGNNVLALGQAIFRRWITIPGRVPDDPEYGAGLGAVLNVGHDLRMLGAWGSVLETEALQDDRVNTITVNVAADALGTTLTISAAVTPNDPATSNFSMTMAVLDDGSAMLKAIKTT